MAQAQQILDPQHVDVFPAYTKTARGNHVLHGLIRLPHHTWPEASLVAKLRALSPAISITIDPDSLL